MIGCKKLQKHILVYSQYFYPEQFRINDICLRLNELGYKVSVVTGIPNYPDGNFYKGYDWKNNRFETWHGIDIYRMPITPRKDNSFNLSLNYLSFVIGSKFKESILPNEVDLVFTYEVSPMTQALPAIWYAKKLNVPHVIYVMDLWPENVVGVTGIKNKSIVAPINKMVDYIYNNSNRILTSSKSFKDSIEDRDINPQKIDFWPQYAEDIYQKQNKNNTEVKVDDLSVPSFVFAGNIGEGQGLEILPKAARLLKTEEIKVKFVLIGDGRAKQQLINLVNEFSVNEYFIFIDRQPANLISYYLAKFDVGLVVLNDDEIFSRTIPAKVQSLMASGMPILVSANGEVQEVVKEANCGLVGDAGNVNQFVENIKKYIEMDNGKINKFGNNALIYNNEYFDKERLLNELVGTFEEEM